MQWHPLASVRRRRRAVDDQPTTRTYYPRRRRPAPAALRPLVVRGADEYRARRYLLRVIAGGEPV